MFKSIIFSHQLLKRRCREINFKEILRDIKDTGAKKKIGYFKKKEIKNIVAKTNHIYISKMKSSLEDILAKHKAKYKEIKSRKKVFN